MLRNNEMIVTGNDYESVMDSMWEFMGKMVAKYYLNDLDSLVGIDPDGVKDIQECIAMSHTMLNTSVKMARQLDQQSEILFELKEEVLKLNDILGDLTEEVEALKSAKAKKAD
jgi:archaellum component FlaC